MRVTVEALLDDYRSGRRRPTEVARFVLDRILSDPDPVWISVADPDSVMAAAEALEIHGNPDLPLYGVPFAVKDNIDVAGTVTTGGYPEMTTPATVTAAAVQRLLGAGALFVGKTNMDQFATGLVGTRSPYGPLSSVSDAERVSGGSSSGSAVAVARGEVAFALGTDTAGSGRVPAAFNGLVGCKPTLGLVSTRGVMPACASLDCVSVFTHTVAGAAAVLQAMAGYDERDPWSRRQQASLRARRNVIGVPWPRQVEIDEPEAERAWSEALARAAGLWQLVEVDISPLLEAAPLLYEVWVAERAASLGSLVESADLGLDPTVAAIIAGGLDQSAVQVFQASHRLARLRREAESIWGQVDALLLPTAPLHPTHAAVAAEPVAVNTRLGRYTNFVNLMDLAGLAVPAGLRADGLPFGVSLLAPAWTDQRVLELGAEWLGEEPPELSQPDAITLAVAGAHMSGQPLSAQLTEQGARPLQDAVTAPLYRFYELAGEGVRRPGLVRVDNQGAAIEVELWEISAEALGKLVTRVPPPLAIGSVELSDGSQVTGFVCQGYAVAGAVDITGFGGWRAYLGTLTPS